MNAIIKNNLVYCPFCGEHDYKVGFYYLVKEGKLMEGICCKCNKEFEFISNLTLGGIERFVIEESEEK